MFEFRNISIKNKLVLTQVIISVIVLGLCFAAFVISEAKGYKERKVKSVITIAQVISTGSSSALQFLDNAAANRILSELNVENDIENAVILDKKGNVFASYARQAVDTFHFAPFPVNAPQFKYENNYLLVNNEIIKDYEILGTVCLKVDLAPLNEIIKQEFEIGLILLIIGICLSFLITLFVQSYISKPLLYLVEVMQSITGSKDYKSRAIVRGRDEISTLSRAFNNMLEQIEKRDNEMELRVKERTSELESANKELESFSYSVSHDMRAPLRAVSGFTQLVSKRYADKLDDEGKDALKIINSEATRMGAIN
jgi:signal transduction histidine kinase